MDPTHDLAQVNVMRLRAGLDTPELAAFVAALAPVNAVADGAPGFVWRLQTAAGGATALRLFDDGAPLGNKSTRRAPGAPTHYVYRSAPKENMRRPPGVAI